MKNFVVKAKRFLECPTGSRDLQQHIHTKQWFISYRAICTIDRSNLNARKDALCSGSVGVELIPICEADYAETEYHYPASRFPQGGSAISC